MSRFKDPSFESQNIPLLSSEARDRKQILGDVHYDLTIAMPKELDFFRGRVKTKFALRDAVDQSKFFVDFQGREIFDVRINEKEVGDGDLEFLNHRIRVLNPDLLLPNTTNTMAFSFENTYVDNSAGLHKYIDPKDERTYIYSHLEPFFCHRWFPCFDQPNVRAPLDLRVLAPHEHWQVIANAKTASKKKVVDLTPFGSLVDGGEFWLHQFEQCPPISSYIYNMCAGEFDVIENTDATCEVPMRIFLRNSKKDNIDAAELFRVMKEGIKFYESYTGVKFPWQKYDQIFCPEFRIGAMENVGAITFTDNFLQPKDSQTEYQLLVLHYVALHELAHMWFGDLVTMDWWNDLWLKESFADFMAAVNLNENEALQNYKHSDQLFLSYLRRALEADKKKSTHPIQVDVNHTEDAVNVFDAICYEKGASFIKQMSHYVGRDILTDGMNEYFTKYALKNTVLPDFIQCLQNAAQKHGKQNMDIQGWANRWLTKAGVNSLNADFSQINGEGNGTLKITQNMPIIGDAVLKEQVLNVKIFGLGDNQLVLEHTQKFDLLAEPETILQISCGFKPEAVLLNAGNLGYADVLLDNSSIGFYLANISKVQTQLDRTYIWMLLCSHVESCEVSPIAFMKCFIENIENESEQQTLTFLLTSVSKIMELYVEDGQSEELSAKIFEALMAKVRQIESVSLRILVMNHTIGFATTAEQKASLQTSLKAGKVQLNEQTSHDLTKAQRYMILRQIFKSEDVSRELKDGFLAEEMKVDYSDVDELQKIGCLACIPDDANKEALWKSYVDKEGFASQSHYSRSQQHFYNPGNKDQCMKFAEFFLQEIDQVKQKYHRDYGQAFFENLSPAFMGKQQHLDKFREIQAHVQENRPSDTHFLKLLSDEIEKIELILKIRAKWSIPSSS